MCGKEGKVREYLPYMTVNPKKFCRRCLAMVEYEDYCTMSGPFDWECVICGSDLDDDSILSKGRCHRCWYNQEFPILG